jgi:hypothetical protein
VRTRIEETSNGGEASGGLLFELEVAAHGPSASAVFDPRLFSGPLLEDHGSELSWHERLRVTLTVGGHQTIAEVIDLAAAEMDIRPGVDVRETESSPERIAELMKLRPFTAGEAAVLLGISEEGAIALMELLGLEEQEADGEWRVGRGGDALFMQRLRDSFLARQNEWPKASDDVERFIAARMRAQVEGQPEGQVVWASEWHDHVVPDSAPRELAEPQDSERSRITASLLSPLQTDSMSMYCRRR